MPYSYNGWPASSTPAIIGINQAWEPVPGHRFPGGTKSGDVQTVLTYLVRALDARVEPIEEYPPGDEWGYNYRPNVNNPSTLSCHASGTAVDYNATQHPNQVDFTWSRTQTRMIHAILDELDGVVKWLEGYDEMHFEIRGTVAQVAAVARKIRNGGSPVEPPTPPPPEDEMHDQVIVKGPDKPEWYITDGITKRWVNDRAEAARLVIRGLARWDGAAVEPDGDKGSAFVWAQQDVDDITTVPRGKTLT